LEGEEWRRTRTRSGRRWSNFRGFDGPVAFERPELRERDCRSRGGRKRVGWFVHRVGRLWPQRSLYPFDTAAHLIGSEFCRDGEARLVKLITFERGGSKTGMKNFDLAFLSISTIQTCVIVWSSPFSTFRRFRSSKMSATARRLHTSDQPYSGSNEITTLDDSPPMNPPSSSRNQGVRGDAVDANERTALLANSRRTREVDTAVETGVVGVRKPWSLRIDLWIAVLLLSQSYPLPRHPGSSTDP
jgi:hypothetical protein